jgi:DNA-binding LacI/PurR family transcriptional regulator
MTKHEKLDGKTRAARYRAAMRAKGYRLKQYWVPDTRTPEFREMARKACEAINASEGRAEALQFAAELQYWPPDDDD